MNKNLSTMVLKNGVIYTVDISLPWAQAIVIKDGIVEFVGSDQEVESYLNSDSYVIDLAGKMVLPGFVDAHAHPSHAMDLVGNISLYGGDSLADYLKEIS
ncbi:MAG: amidohydrolase family protein, partial [Anaerolineales bacterium]